MTSPLVTQESCCWEAKNLSSFFSERGGRSAPKTLFHTEQGEDSAVPSGAHLYTSQRWQITKWRGTYTSRCKWTYLKGFCRSNYGYIDTVGKQLIYYIDHLHLPLSWWMRYTRCTACRRSLRSREVHHHGPKRYGAYCPLAVKKTVEGL